MRQPYVRTYWAFYPQRGVWHEAAFTAVQGGHPSRIATFHEDLGYPQDRAQQIVDMWNGHSDAVNAGYRYSLTKPEDA